MTRAVITVGMGYGDEGKGATVDALVRATDARLVIRYSGGHQCGHNVVLPNGKSHCFSQFGAGSLAGAETWVDRDVIVEPFAMFSEANALRRILGYTPKIGVHPRCLVTTPYHRIANREIEKRNRHGSCGVGIGETRRMWLQHGSDSLMFEDLRCRGTMADKLWLVRARLREHLWANGVPGDPLCDALSPLQLATEFSARCGVAAMRERPVITGTVVFEGAQGVLLDEYHGDHPHTTWSTVTQRNAVEFCDSASIPYKVLGVIRAYMVRHGAGPLDGEDPKLSFREDHNRTHDWQGRVRYAYHARETLRRSIAIVQPDAIALNHMDQVPDAKVLRDVMADNGIPVAVTGKGQTYLARHWNDTKAIFAD